MKGDEESGALIIDNTKWLVIWTVTSDPSDYPGEFVARAHVVGQGGSGPTKYIVRGKTLKDIHDQLPPGLVRFPRDDSDDPKIVESWM
jgi:hypothetical protein